MRLDVLEQNRHLLHQGIELLRSLDDSRFGASGGPDGTQASAGAHLRHVIDFYQALLRGFESGRIDYDARQRDPRIESDRAVAIAGLSRILGQLESLAEASADQPLQVKVDAPPGEIPFQIWSRSSLKRELQFLLSHTVHHYALMRLTLQQQGFFTVPEFGVAPSTLTYRGASA